MVFSDHSLAYGVNMPFRTCAFCGQMGDLLTPLMAQQMGGRAGRRGLDTQGNLAYLGMPVNQIKELMQSVQRKVRRVPGLLDVEVLVSAEDPQTYNVLTRWENQAVLDDWVGSELCQQVRSNMESLLEGTAHPSSR